MRDAGLLDQVVTAFDRCTPPIRLGAAIRSELMGLRAFLRGDPATARTELRAASEGYRELGQVLSRAIVDVSRVRVLGLDDPEGRAAADEARGVIDRLGARGLGAWLDRAITESGAERVQAAVGHAGSAPAAGSTVSLERA